ncbi:MAG TPA: DUF1080 domain-containing protein [Verrucomicrobiales bacterium]|nr:DUF1080 domain-containing protein [Verrucomicrobiales bacterium]
MKTQVTAFALLAGVFVLTGWSAKAAERKPELLSEQERRAGWQSLFDGKTTDGWRNYRKEGVSSGWVVENGELIRRGKGAGDLITREKFGSFELILDYKISMGGNSGLMFHVTEEAEKPWQTGPELQIQDNAAGKDPQKAGWLYQLYRAEQDLTKPAGEWNELRLVVTQKGGEVWMNGQRYYSFVKGGDDWNERVAKSKFAKFPLFGKAVEGHICLQDHGNGVAFRNIRIRALDDRS